MRRLFAGLLAVSLAAPSLAQAQGMTGDRASIAAVETLWRQITGYITQVAEETAEADYAWRPTSSVRSVGEMIGHVAGAQYLICAAALGDPPRDEDAIERSATTKAALVAALKESSAYCATAYARTDAALGREVELFGSKGTAFYALTLNATHNGEHYGNLITYLRMRGVVPPSSRRP